MILSRRNSNLSFEAQDIDRMMSVFCEEYRLPVASLETILTRKELKMAVWKRAIYPWEQHIFGGSLTASLVFQNRMFRNVVSELAKEYFLPKFENYYNMKVKEFYLFLGSNDRPSLYQFGACRFCVPFHSLVETDDEFSRIEERLAASVAKGLKAAVGRGPKAVRVYVVTRNIVVYVFQELWGEAQRKSCLGNDEICRSMEDYFDKIVLEVIAPEQKREFGAIIEYHMDFDIQKNALAVIAICGPVI